MNTKGKPQIFRKDSNAYLLKFEAPESEFLIYYKICFFFTSLNHIYYHIHQVTNFWFSIYVRQITESN